MTGTVERPPQLLAGPYKAPKCKRGDWLKDEVKGMVEVFGHTQGPLKWPRIRQQGKPCPVLTSELARAVRTESAAAIAYWWGVSTKKVRQWRSALGVERYNEGSRALRERPTPPATREALLRGAKRKRGPEWSRAAHAWMERGKRAKRNAQGEPS